MSNCIQSVLVERRHKYWPRFQANLASVPQPIRAKTGSKTRFSVIKEHALKGHRLDWYSDLSEISWSFITISAKFEKDFTMWPRRIEDALINSARPGKMLRGKDTGKRDRHFTTAHPVQIPKHGQNRTESRLFLSPSVIVSLFYISRDAR